MPEKDGFEASSDILKLQDNMHKVMTEYKDVLRLSN